MIDEFIMPGSETLTDLSHLDQAFNKSQSVSSSKKYN
jgi:hypothetical protein